MQIQLSSNAPKFFKKIQKDFGQFNSGIREGVADLTNMAFKEIRDKKIIQGKYSPSKPRVGKRKASKKIYGSFPGANKLNSKGRKVFHKTKIVTRSGFVLEKFKPISWSRNNCSSSTLASGNNGASEVEIKIKKTGKEVYSKVSFSGKTEKLLSLLQYGRGARSAGIVEPGKSISEKKDSRKGQRRAIANGYRTAIRKWNKVVKGVMDGHVRKMGYM